MAVRVRERSGPWLGILLAGSLVTFALFGALSIATRDWRAGVFALIAVIGGVRSSLAVNAARLPVGRHADGIADGPVFTAP